ncbi:MAG: DUF1178 family protein [Rhodospirillaceae bacterium]|nr:DUF1178 family protein [Rhodospirillaceae bacterium]
MIVFSLQCSKNHSFDEWFSSSADYDTQKKSKAIACPTCGDKKIEKALMAPSVGKSAAAPAPACGAPACGNGACPMSGVR